MQISTLEQKQAFLRNEIIDGGIDATNFMEFMGRIKGEGSNIDLDNWTGEELKKVVRQFKEEIIRPASIELSKLDSAKKSKIFESVIDVKRKKIAYQCGGWDYEINEMRDCRKAIPCRFRLKEGMNPQIKVDKYEVKTLGGFIFGIGAKKELEMTLSTNFTEGTVVRKCEDFDWLRESIIKRYPGYFVPPLEVYREIYQEDKEGVRLKVFEVLRFINSLTRYDYFRYSFLIETFFLELNPKKFADFRSAEAQHEVDKNPDSIENLDAKMKFQITNELQQFLKGATIFSNQLAQIYTDLSALMHKVLSDMENLRRHTENMRKSCLKLQNCYSQMAGLYKTESIEAVNMMTYFSDLLNDITKGIGGNMKIFSDFAKTFTKNAENDWRQFVANGKRRSTQTQNYVNFKNNLQKKKDKYFSDRSKWEISETQMVRVNRMGSTLTRQQAYEIMFPSDNMVQLETRMWLAFVNQNYKNSLLTLLHEQEKELKSGFISYSYSSVAITQKVNKTLQFFMEIVM